MFNLSSVMKFNVSLLTIALMQNKKERFNAALFR